MKQRIFKIGFFIAENCVRPKRRERLLIFIATVVSFVLLMTQAAVADVLFLNSDNKPIHGLIESVDESKLVFQVYRNSDHTFSRREFLRKDVKQMVRTVDQQRLSSLTIDQLVEYRDLAEELSSLGNDPVARRLALRLTFLCLHHADSTEQGRVVRESAAANLLTLAQNEAEREQFKLIGFLAGHSEGRPQQVTELVFRDAAVAKTMLQIVTAIRRENFVEASLLLESESGKTATAQWSGHCSPKLLLDAVGQKQVDSELLPRLLAIEIRIRYGGDDPLAPISDAQRMANSHNQKPSGPRWIPLLQQVSEYDLDQTEFKDGQWRKPN